MPRSSVASIRLFMALLFGDFFWSAPALAGNYCADPGTTISSGSSLSAFCVQPNVVWEGEDNQLFASALEAAQSVADASYQLAPSNIKWHYSSGVLLAPVNFDGGQDCIWDDVSNGYTFQYFNNTNTPSPYYNVFAYGFKPTSATCGGTYSFNSSLVGYVDPSFVCPSGYRLVLDYPSGPNIVAPNYGHMCLPITPSQANDSEPCDSCDMETAGQAEGGNPVEIASRYKRGRAIDLQTGGQFPIVWSRNYSSQQGLGWRFVLPGRSTYRDIFLNEDYLLFERGNGTWLSFKAAKPSPGQPHAWIPVKSSWWVIRSRPVDLFDGSGNLTGFALVTKGVDVETYSLAGRLLKVNRRGQEHHYNYDTRGRMSRIEDDFGHYLDLSYSPADGAGSLSVSWLGSPGATTPDTSSLSILASDSRAYHDADARIISVSDGVRSVSYEYAPDTTSNGTTAPFRSNLVKVVKADASELNYVYGETIDGVAASKMLMTGIVDEAGNRISSYKYDGYWVAKEWKHTVVPGAQTELFLFATNKLTDPMGNEFPFSRASDRQITAYTKDCLWCRSSLNGKQITYANGMPTSITDFNNNQTKATYDTNGLILTRTEGFGSALARPTTWTWDTALRLPLTMVEPTRIGGVNHTRTTTWAYDSVGRPLTRVVSASSGEPSRTTTLTYNASGLPETITDPAGMITKLTYHASGDVASITEGFGTALARTTTLGAYTVSGKPGWTMDPAGTATRITWDAMDRPTLIEQGIPAGGDPTASGGTWEATMLTYTPFGNIASMTRPDGTRLEFSYTVAHRLIQVRSLSTASVLLGQIDYTLNAAGQVVSETMSQGGVVISTQSRTYDTLARLDTLVGAQSQVTDLGFDAQGNPVSTNDPLNHTRTQQVDALNRVVKQIDALLGESTLAYDPQDNLTVATDARGVATTYAYNAFNELLAASSADRGTWTYTYDAAGNPVTVADPRGVVATATYDLLGRPLTMSWDASAVPGATPGFVSGARSVAWTWDTCQTGRLCARSDWSGATAYAYDGFGRLAGEAFVPAGQTDALANGYGFDAYGRLAARTYPSGKILTYTHGADGRVVSMAWAGQAQLNNITWQAFDGPELGWTWAAAGIPSTKSQVAFTYDQDGRLSHISDIDEIDLVHDANSRLTGTAHLVDPTLDQVHAYDAEDRLLSTDTSLWAAPWLYTWDAVGNRTSKLQVSNGWQNAYGLTHNRLAAVSTVSGGVASTSVARTYDAMGNTIKDGSGKIYGFDATGRMASFNNGATGATFVVGTDGLRSRKTVSGVGATVRLYAYDDQRRLIGVYVPDGSGGFTVSEELVYLPDSWTIVGTVRGQVVGGADGDFYPVLSDQLGAPRAVLDPANGDTRWAWAGKEAFGATAPDETPGTAGVFRFDARFPGQWADPETGLFHNGFRDYDPATGRYVQSDPIGLGGGWNTYGYVGGGVPNKVDTLGLLESPADIMNKAFLDAAQNSRLPLPIDGPQDAYRHCLASCEMTRENGAMSSLILGEAHELMGNLTGQTVQSCLMDRRNNTVGRGFGKDATSFNDCRSACMGAVKNGKTLNNAPMGSDSGFYKIPFLWKYL